MAKHSSNLGLILLLLIVSPVMVAAEQKVFPWVGILVVVISLALLVISVVVLIIINITGCCCGGANTDNHQPQPLETARGLDAKTIAALPTLQFSEIKMRRVGQGELECAVCLHEFEDEERLCLLPNCSHVFHPHCIGPWLSSHATCPVCRACFECGQGLGSGVGTSNIMDHHVVEIEGSSSQVSHSCTKLPKCHSTGQLRGA